jgi:hypothetical protein
MGHRDTIRSGINSTVYVLNISQRFSPFSPFNLSEPLISVCSMYSQFLKNALSNVFDFVVVDWDWILLQLCCSTNMADIAAILNIQLKGMKRSLRCPLLMNMIFHRRLH